MIAGDFNSVRKSDETTDEKSLEPRRQAPWGSLNVRAFLLR